MVLSTLATAFLAVAIAYPSMTSANPTDWLPMSMLCLVVSAGLFLRRKWSKHLLFGIAVSYAVEWPATVAASAWTNWPYPDSLLMSGMSLIPGLIWMGIWTGGYLLARTQFKPQRPGRL